MLDKLKGKYTLRMSEQAKVILEARYLVKDEAGNVVETPEELFYRVAGTVAKAERDFPNGTFIEHETYTEKFYALMTSLDFLPNSPTLMNAGRPLGQLAGCFVLPVPDSIDGIFEAVKHAALIHKSGGGTGFNFSHLRAKNSAVKSTGSVASGPVSFMRVFNAATEAIKQGGTRRGANLGLLRVDHPDILEFLDAKITDGELSNFNLSVGLTDEYMLALKSMTGNYKLTDGKYQNARGVFNILVERAHANGEPGVVFVDAVERGNPTPDLGPLEGVNPCGEQPLLPYEACNLGSINLANFVIYNKYDEGMVIDYDRLREVVALAVRFLDDVVEINKYPLPKIEKICKSNRKIGLGVMGWADLLYKLRIPYDSDEALTLADKVMECIDVTAHHASIELGQERGNSVNYRRNATLTTVAPTGTLSMLADCSGGIEPVYALTYEKHVLGRDFKYVHPEYNKYMTSGSHEYDEVFITAADVSPEWHVRMQAAFQRHVDNAVSKTINLPSGATVDDVRAAIILAHELGCKGVTVYRDGSRSGQVLTSDSNTSVAYKPAPSGEVVGSSKVGARPRIITGKTIKSRTGCGSLYVTVNEHDGRPFEVFTTRGKSGGCAAANAEAVSRLTSLALRSGVPVADVVHQLRGIRCSTPTWHNGKQILSCPDALAEELSSRVPDGIGLDGSESNKGIHTFDPSKIFVDAHGCCPECGDTVRHEESCRKCLSCGWSKCG